MEECVLKNKKGKKENKWIEKNSNSSKENKFLISGKKKNNNKSKKNQ